MALIDYTKKRASAEELKPLENLFVLTGSSSATNAAGATKASSTAGNDSSTAEMSDESHSSSRASSLVGVEEDENHNHNNTMDQSHNTSSSSLGLPDLTNHLASSSGHHRTSGSSNTRRNSISVKKEEKCPGGEDSLVLESLKMDESTKSIGKSNRSCLSGLGSLPQFHHKDLPRNSDRINGSRREQRNSRRAGRRAQLCSTRSIQSMSNLSLGAATTGHIDKNTDGSLSFSLRRRGSTRSIMANTPSPTALSNVSEHTAPARRTLARCRTWNDSQNDMTESNHNNNHSNHNPPPKPVLSSVERFHTSLNNFDASHGDLNASFSESFSFLKTKKTKEKSSSKPPPIDLAAATSNIVPTPIQNRRSMLVRHSSVSALQSSTSTSGGILSLVEVTTTTTGGNPQQAAAAARMGGPVRSLSNKSLGLAASLHTPLRASSVFSPMARKLSQRNINHTEDDLKKLPDTIEIVTHSSSKSPMMASNNGRRTRRSSMGTCDSGDCDESVVSTLTGTGTTISDERAERRAARRRASAAASSSLAGGAEEEDHNEETPRAERRSLRTSSTGTIPPSFRRQNSNKSKSLADYLADAEEIGSPCTPMSARQNRITRREMMMNGSSRRSMSARHLLGTGGSNLSSSLFASGGNTGSNMMMRGGSSHYNASAIATLASKGGRDRLGHSLHGETASTGPMMDDSSHFVTGSRIRRGRDMKCCSTK